MLMMANETNDFRLLEFCDIITNMRQESDKLDKNIIKIVNKC